MPAHAYPLRQTAGFLSVPAWLRPAPGRIALTLLLGLLLFVGGCAVSRLQTSAELSHAARPLQANPPSPSHRLLIVGDSTAVGTGASSPARSLAGLIAQRHPDWRIENRAQNGARCSALQSQLRNAGAQDTVLILCGGNDVLGLTGRDELHDALLGAARDAAGIAREVILMPPGNIGHAPMMFAPLSWWMTARSRDLHEISEAVAQESGARLVNLFREGDDDPFAQAPERMHAADGLHPGDAGYAVWADVLRREAGV